jgi:hypothetical protein
MAQSADPVGHRIRHSDALDHAVRVGFLAHGLVHPVVAWLAVELALGNSSGRVSSNGALQQLGRQPLVRSSCWSWRSGCSCSCCGGTVPSTS